MGWINQSITVCFSFYLFLNYADPPSPFQKMSFLKMPRKTTRVPFEIRNELLKKEVQFVENKEREKNEVSWSVVLSFANFLH